MTAGVEVLSGGAAVALSLAGCFTDLRSRKIPNLLTFGGAICAVGFHLVVGGPWSAATSVGGWLLGVLLFAPVFAVGGLGAGDVKLLGALGAWIGPGRVLYLALFTAMAGGVMALVVMLARGYSRTVGRNLMLMATSWRLGIAAVPGLTLEDAPGPRLAYALPIAAGTVLTLWLR